MVATIISYFTHFSYFTIDRFHYPHLARVLENERRDERQSPYIFSRKQRSKNIINDHSSPADRWGQDIVTEQRRNLSATVP